MNIDVLVIGSGGNGQTTVMKKLRELQLSTNSLTNADSLKHLYNPLTNHLKKVNVKLCIFVYNKSFHSVCSHYRRDWGYKQICTLGNRSRLKKRNVKTIDQFLTLVEEKDRELFSIKFQFLNWYNTKQRVKFPVYFLNFENYDLNEQTNLANAINKFVVTDKKFAPEQLRIHIVPRHQYDDLEKKYVKAAKLYNDFDEKMKELVSKSNANLLPTRSFDDNQDDNGS